MNDYTDVLKKLLLPVFSLFLIQTSALYAQSPLDCANKEYSACTESGMQLQFCPNFCITDDYTITPSIPADFEYTIFLNGCLGITPPVDFTEQQTTLFFEACTDMGECDSLILHLFVGDSTACQGIWPGDTNQDGVVNVGDLLNIGLGYGETGPARQAISFDWAPQPIMNWAPSMEIPMIPYAHADCNGDGTINANDVEAIEMNYNFRHFKQAAMSSVADGIPMFLEMPNDSLTGGTVVEIPIILGTEIQSVENIYGLTFSIMYDPTYVEEESIEVLYDESWIGTTGTNLIGLHRDHWQYGQLDVGLTRIDHNNVMNGFGQVISLRFVLIDDLAGKDANDYISFELTFSNIQAIQADLTPLDIESHGGSLTLVTSNQNLLPKETNTIQIFPNPSHTTVQISALQYPIKQIRLLNGQGQEVYQQFVQTQKTTIPVHNLPKGLYFLYVERQNDYVLEKLLVQ